MRGIRLGMLFCKSGSGFSLVEVLVALVVLSVGLLGIAGSSLFSLRESHLAYQYSLANVMAENMQERLLVSLSTPWNPKNTVLLPGSKGTYSCQESHCEVTVTWPNGQVKI